MGDYLGLQRRFPADVQGVLKAQNSSAVRHGFTPVPLRENPHACVDERGGHDDESLLGG